MVQEEQGYNDSSDEQRRGWNRRGDDRLAEHRFAEISKRLDKIDKTLETRRDAVDSAIKALEDLYDELFKEPDGAIYQLRKRNVEADLRHANLKFLVSLGVTASAVVGGLVGGLDKIKALFKDWLT